MKEMNEQNEHAQDEHTEENETIEVLENEEVETEAEQETEESTVTNEEVEKLQEEKRQLEERALRLQAEFENFKKRTQREKEAAQKYKAQDLVNDLLPVKDNFDRALDTEVDEASKGFKEGIEMVYKQLTEALTSHGVEEIATVGEEFDPNLHHAVMQANDENYDSNIVVEELQKGYSLKDRVIRPAMVKVNQ